MMNLPSNEPENELSASMAEPSQSEEAIAALPTESESEASEVLERKPKKKKRAKKIILIILCVLLALILLLVGSFAALWITGRSRLLGYEVSVSMPSELVESAEEDGTRVEHSGQTYVYNKNAVNILFMGIDKQDISNEKGYGSNGQADCLLVLNLDTVTGAIKILPISRETMVDVNIYTADGEYGGVENTQICLAYAYGSNGKESCENVRKAVSRLLYGVEIGSYVAIDLDGVRALSDVIGGVELKALETIKIGKKTPIVEGKQILLKGENVDAYLRHRGQDVEANARRMQRQKQFITAFASRAGNQVLSDFGKLTKFYNTAKPYTVTDITISELTYLASCCLTADVGSSIVYYGISGQSVMGEEHIEFYADSESVFQAVLDTFYTVEEK